ncbi:MAG: hypothetical protein K2O24_04945 [Muribaculaceae bacterium]|nr:hypothetical protein [Muribaculaceae bacterium]
MKKCICLGIALMSLFATGCSSDAPENPVPEPTVKPEIRPEWKGRPLSEVAPRNVGKANGFAINLFKTLFEDNSSNLCISPASVFMNLAMLANGDSGEGRDEITRMLGYGTGEEALEDLNIYCNALLTEVPRTQDATGFTISNSLWHDPEVQINPSFSWILSDAYSASVFPVSLRTESGMRALNDFVGGKTAGLIPEFLKQPLQCSVTLLNTVWFKGCWEKPFDERFTLPGTFTNLDGSPSEADFMSMEDVMDYAEVGNIRAVRLPYKGDRFTMTVMLPSAGSDFRTMLHSLTPETFTKINEELSMQNIYLALPRFEGELSIELLDALESMGLHHGTSTGYNSISDALYPLVFFKHAVKIIVDEKGTEAAAASAAGMENGVTPVMICNSPFMYVIRDNLSDTVLFMGAVTGF